MEKTAIELNKTAAVKTAGLAMAKRWIDYVNASYAPITSEQMKYYNEAVSEMVYTASLTARSNLKNPANFISVTAGPHSWYGVNVPGCRGVFDNPDTIYRSVRIDPSSTYVIYGQRTKQQPIDENFSVWDARSTTLDNLTGSDLVVNADGSFTITVDSNSSVGKTNHLQLKTNATQIFTRNTIKDWAKEGITGLRIECKSGCVSTSEDFNTLTTNTVNAINLASTAVFTSYYAGYTGRALNTLANVTKGGGGGYLSTQAQSRGIWSINDNQTLVVNVNLGGAKYFTLPVYDKWMITTDPVNHTMTLNNGQAKMNTNGTYTFVIAPKDPGVYNWVDTNGLHDGMTLLRWQGLPGTPPASGNASATMKLVPLATLNASLPAGTVFVTPAQRKQQINERAAAYALRYQTDKVDDGHSTGCVMNPEAGLTWETAALFAASIAFLVFKSFRNRKE